jgi:hypothetical protein
MRLYLAGASAEVEVCEWYRDRLLAEGVEIVHNWMAGVRANPERRDNEIPRRDRKRIAATCANYVTEADVFWLLSPRESTIGAWVELGIAFGSARSTIVVSGPWRSVFGDLADLQFTEHAHAFEHIVGMMTEERNHG